MLEVSALPSPSKADQRAFVGFLTSAADCDFMVDVDDNLLDYIDFRTCDVPSLIFDADGDILPNLEVDPTELLDGFSDGACEAQHGDGETKPPPEVKQGEAGQKLRKEDETSTTKRLLLEEDDKKLDVRRNGEEGSSAVTTEDSSAAPAGCSDAKSSAEGHSASKKKPSVAAAGNNNNSSSSSHGKRKVKVDWTPELHRRFVQAVEQLGIDKAVPSRILEIMGSQCLTRHNIASHLQKYRSHRKHLMAREAEAAAAAATWAHKRQQARKDSPWFVPLPTIGFPPPLHVWGHAAEPPPPMLPVWPRHLQPPPRPWPPAPAYWHQQQYNHNAARKWGPHAVTQGTPCMPPMPPAAAMLPRFPAPMYRDRAVPVVIPPPSSISKLAGLQLQLDAHPSKESIDATIGDVLVKPWLPLPLGLKPPSLHSVMSELHKQGIPKVPPPPAPATTS